MGRAAEAKGIGEWRRGRSREIDCTIDTLSYCSDTLGKNAPSVLNIQDGAAFFGRSGLDHFWGHRHFVYVILGP